MYINYIANYIANYICTYIYSTPSLREVLPIEDVTWFLILRKSTILYPHLKEAMEEL